MRSGAVDCIHFSSEDPRLPTFCDFQRWGGPLNVRLRRPVGDSAWFSLLLTDSFVSSRFCRSARCDSSRHSVSLAVCHLSKTDWEIFPYVESPPTTVPAA